MLSLQVSLKFSMAGHRVKYTIFPVVDIQSFSCSWYHKMEYMLVQYSHHGKFPGSPFINAMIVLIEKMVELNKMWLPILSQNSNSKLCRLENCHWQYISQIHHHVLNDGTFYTAHSALINSGPSWSYDIVTSLSLKMPSTDENEVWLNKNIDHGLSARKL